jgi:pimeloyl-ACP methyl ester carboxylesterase
MMPSNTFGTIVRKLAPSRPSPHIRSFVPEEPTGKPPLLFVHGVMHGAWSWEENWVPAAVDRGWPCHVLDLYRNGREGNGGSRRLWTLMEVREDIIEAMETMPEPPVLVGHSTSGLLVQHILAEDEQKASAGVLVASVPPHGGYKFPFHLLRHHPTDLVRAGAMRPLPPRRDYFFSERLDDATVMRYLDRFESASVLSQLELGMPRRVPEIDLPLLVLGAEDDSLIDPVDVVRTARSFGTQARMFRGMGHSMMLDAGWRAPLEVMLHWVEDEALAD